MEGRRRKNRGRRQLAAKEKMAEIVASGSCSSSSVSKLHDGSLRSYRERLRAARSLSGPLLEIDELSVGCMCVYVTLLEMYVRARMELRLSSDCAELGLSSDYRAGVLFWGPPVNMGSEINSNSKLLTLPTILTLARIAAVPLLVATFYLDGRRGTAACTIIFTAAAVTDWLDGYIARKMNLNSTFGAFLDPVADKLMVAATLVLLCTRPLEVAVFSQAPWLLIIPSIIIIGREITMSALREWAASQGSKLLEAVAVNNLGKWKTATQMTALTILLATRNCSHGGPALLVGSGVVLLYMSAGLAIWSFVVYMRKIWKVLLR
ncbi:hypothetical protein RIF29_13820 [Crotalaria pallida]|uniref:CDP-diacylglycerol--glycerol-3-phosphate 1-phosphatidyltransferase n=1 Tax=Crotalaria pallida TaxID=3830 RepID=A0AAN9FCN0_CROPI